MSSLSSGIVNKKDDMTDDQQTTPPATDDKNPLDVLEELLKDSGGSGSGGSQPAQDPQNGELSEEELAQKRAEFELKQQEQQEVDAQKLAQQQELLKTLKDTPQYQARVHQEEEKEQEKEAEEQAGDGYEVTQLKHDKI